MFNQVMDTAMGIKFAPPYVNLSVGLLEETVLVPCKWNYSKDIWMTIFSHGIQSSKKGVLKNFR